MASPRSNRAALGAWTWGLVWLLSAPCAAAGPWGPVRPPPPPPAPPPEPELAPANLACLGWLREQAVPFAEPGAQRGVRTPVEATGAIAGLTLRSRARRRPIMDCELLRALAEAAPIFAEVGIDQLAFSGAYDYRTRRHSNKLSEHARGLAIDVHAVRLAGTTVDLDVQRDWQAGVGEWKASGPLAEDVGPCVGNPTTDAARRLRTLACRLRSSSLFRLVISPDDDADHRDHLHLEAYPDVEARIRGLLPRARE